MSSSSGSMYKIEKKDKRLFVNAGASFRGLFTRRSKRSKKKDQASADEVSCDRLTVDGHGIILYITFGICLSSILSSRLIINITAVQCGPIIMNLLFNQGFLCIFNSILCLQS